MARLRNGTSLVCLALFLLHQLGTVFQGSFVGGGRLASTVTRAAKSVDVDVVSKKESQTFNEQTGLGLEKELQKELSSGSSAPAPVAGEKEEATPSTAAQKTAETKERVAEKRRRLQSEAAAAEASEEFTIDWVGYAKQARDMAVEAGKEAAKPGKESSVARAKELALNFVASGCDAAAEAPILFPAGVSVATLVVLLALTSGRPAETRPIRAPAAPVLVSVQPKPASPGQGVRSEAPTTALPAAPDAPAPAPAPAPPKQTKQDLPWARTFANSAADALRTIAEELPAAEKTVEEELPVAESALSWASSVTSENAPEKIEKDVLPAAGRFAGDLLRAGLRAGAVGLDFASQNLPAAEKALGSVVDTSLPYAQSALREAASGARSLAKEGVALPGDGSNSIVNSLASAAPDVLSATAQVLEATADAAPQVKSVVGAAVTQVTPIAQVTLGVASDVVEGVSNIPSSVVQEGAGKLADAVKSSVPKELASNAQQLVDEAASKILPRQ